MIRPLLSPSTRIIKDCRFLHNQINYNLTPEQQLFGPKYREWEHADYGIDNPGLTSPLISRNNVGLGFLILNSNYGNSKQNKLLYRKLRDLEVNIYKRYVVLTSITRNTFHLGWDPLELLELAEGSQKTGEIDLAFTRHFDELSNLIHLIATYRKPLITYANGDARGYGISIWALSNRAAAYKHSKLSINNLDGGLSCVLALTRGFIGEYLALTGYQISGSDLVNTGIGNRWISPDAFAVMEQTSSTQLTVSEQDAAVLLEDHSLEFPEMAHNSIITWESIINYHFKHKSVEEIIFSLKQGAPTDIIEFSGKSASQITNWENEIAEILESRPPLAAKITLGLIRDARMIRNKLMKEGDISISLWKKLNDNKKTCPKTILEANQQMLRDTFVEEMLIESLKNEMNAAHDYIMSFDIIEAIRSNITRNTSAHIQPYYRSFDLKRTDRYSSWEPRDRGWFSLSSIPQLRRLNIHYDNKTGLDYDPDQVFVQN